MPDQPIDTAALVDELRRLARWSQAMVPGPRLAEAADVIEQLTAERDRLAASIGPVEEHARQVEALYNRARSEARAMRPVVEAALAWREEGGFNDGPDFLFDPEVALIAAVDTYRAIKSDGTAGHAQSAAAGPESPAVGAEPGETITGAQRGAQAADCPTCSGPIRETVGMICQTCGTDYGPPEEEPEQPLTLIAPNGCDDCTVEPGEHHRHLGCPGNHRAITRQAREASQQAHEAAHEAFRRDLANLRARPGGFTWPNPTAE